MRESGKRLAQWSIVLLAVVVVAGVLLDGRPRHLPLGVRANTFCAAMEYQYHRLGLLPPSDMGEFYSSILGKRFRSLSGREKVIGGEAQDIRVRRNTTRDSIIVSVSAELVLSSDKGGVKRTPFLCKHDWHCEPREQTRVLLSMITAGTRRWDKHLPNEPTIDHAFPESGLIEAPDIGFDRPRTTTQMRKYHTWLIRMAGSGRLRDGWNRKVLLKLGSETTRPILSAQSAGPDGKWHTNDDIVLQRDADTGRIVFKQGF